MAARHQCAASPSETLAVRQSYERLLDDRLRDELRLRDEVRLRDELRFRGTFAPSFRASDSPIAIACFRLFTFPPCPLLPRLSVPCFRRRIALSTLLLAFRLYLRPPDFRPPFFAAMSPPAKRGQRERREGVQG
jgi:hypothetical protein